MNWGVLISYIYHLSQISFNFGAFQTLPRLSLSFVIKYTKVKSATENSPPPGATYKTYPGTFVIENPQNYGTVIDYTARVGRVYLKGSGAALTSINVASLFAGASSGQGYWFVFELVSNYPTTKTLPYTGTMLARIKQIKTVQRSN